MELKILAGHEIALMEQKMPPDQRASWPADCCVIYAIEEDRPVGRMALMSIKVVEGSWVSSEKRGTSLAYRMMVMMEQFAAALGNTHLLALQFNEQPEIAEYLKRVGFELFPVQMFSKELVKAEEQAA